MPSPLQVRQLPGPMASPALPSSGTAEVLGAATDILDSFSSRAFAAGRQAAAVQADEAGTAAGLEGSSERRSTWTEAGRRFNAAADRAQGARISIETRRTMAELARQHEDNPAAFAAAVGIGEGGPTGKGLLAAKLDGLSPALQLEVRANIEERFGAHYERLMERAHQAALRGAAADFLEDAEGMLQEAFLAAGEGGAAGQAAIARLSGTDEQPGVFFERVADALESGAITPERAAALSSSFREGVARETVLGQFKRAGNKSAFLTQFNEANPGALGLTHEDQRQLSRFMHAEIQTARHDVLQAQALEEAELRKRRADVDRRIGRSVEALELGILPTTEDGRAEVRSLFQEAMAVGSDRAEDLQRALSTAALTAEVQSMPLERAEAHVAQVTADAPTSPLQAHRQNAARKALAALRAGLKDDPAQFARDRGIGAGLPAFDTSSPDALRDSLRTRRQAADAASAIYGTEVPTLTNSEASSLEQALAAGDGPTRAAFLGVMERELGAQAAPVLRSLADKGAGAVAIAAGHQVAGQAPLATEILRGLDVLAADPGMAPDQQGSTGGVSLWTRAADEAFAGVYDEPGLARRRADVIEAARALYATRMQGRDANARRSFDAGAARKALEDAAGGVAEWSGSEWWQVGGPTSRVELPPGVSPDGFGEWLSGLTVADISAAGGMAGRTDTAAVEDFKRWGRLVSLGGGAYAVRIGATLAASADGSNDGLFVLRYGAPATAPLRGTSALDGELGVFYRPDGGTSTELSITVTDPRLNGGRPTNIPQLVRGQSAEAVERILDGKPTAEDTETAIVRAAERVAMGARLPAFDSIEAAVAAAKARSEAKGKATP